MTDLVVWEYEGICVAMERTDFTTWQTRALEFSSEGQRASLDLVVGLGLPLFTFVSRRKLRNLSILRDLVTGTHEDLEALLRYHSHEKLESPEAVPFILQPYQLKEHKKFAASFSDFHRVFGAKAHTFKFKQQPSWLQDTLDRRAKR